MITILGSINLDLIATVGHLPKPGETVSGNGFSTAAGGKGSNQALAARRAGSTVEMAGAIGRDEFAGSAIAMLKEAGTGLSMVKETDEPTGTALILVGSDGENMIAVVPGANGTVTTEDADAALAAMSKGDYLLLQMEIPAGSVEHALDAAKARGVITVFNTAPMSAEAARLAERADIVIANETEFAQRAGVESQTADERVAELKRLHAATGQTLIVTLGGDGVIAMHDGAFHSTKGLVIEPVDTVGAGDTFCGYFAASLDQGLDFAAALRRAAAAGSLACLKPGAQPSIPMAEEVAARL
ncbi:ribokinase [Rhizobium sp. PAMB 3182]